MKKYYYTMYVLFSLLLLIVTAICVPSLLISGEYGKLCFFSLLVVCMVLGIVYLHRILVAPAQKYSVTENTVQLVDGKRLITLNVADIQKVVITPYRYIFYAQKRYCATRVIGAFKIEKDINPALIVLLQNMNVPIVYKWMTLKTTS